jgi:hypothetical protein
MRPVRMADNLTTFMCRLSWNLGASNSWNPHGLSRPVMGLLYLCFLQLTVGQYCKALCFLTNIKSREKWHSSLISRCTSECNFPIFFRGCSREHPKTCFAFLPVETPVKAVPAMSGVANGFWDAFWNLILNLLFLWGGKRTNSNLLSYLTFKNLVSHM